MPSQPFTEPISMIDMYVDVYIIGRMETNNARLRVYNTDNNLRDISRPAFSHEKSQQCNQSGCMNDVRHAAMHSCTLRIFMNKTDIAANLPNLIFAICHVTVFRFTEQNSKLVFEDISNPGH
eukprot:279644_1